MDANFKRILRPFCVLSPVSVTIASASLSARVYKSAMYRVYVILSVVPSMVIISCQVLENQTFVPFSPNGAIFIYSMLYLSMNANALISFGKMRMEKLIMEIQKLDEMLRFEDKALVTKMMVHNVLWVLYIYLLHGGAVVLYCIQCLKNVTNHSLCYFGAWFGIIDIVMISEMACFSCFTILLYTRLKYFALYLSSLPERRDKDRELNVTLCYSYRQIHRVLEAVQKVFHAQMVTVIAFNFYSSLRIFLIMMRFQISVSLLCLDILKATQLFAVFVVLGLCGHGVAVQLRRVHALATLMTHSQNDRLQSVGARLSREAAVRRVALTALDTELNARLPLRVAASLAAAVIVLMQLRVTVTK